MAPVANVTQECGWASWRHGLWARNKCDERATQTSKHLHGNKGWAGMSRARARDERGRAHMACGCGGVARHGGVPSACFQTALALALAAARPLIATANKLVLILGVALVACCWPGRPSPTSRPAASTGCRAARPVSPVHEARALQDVIEEKPAFGAALAEAPIFALPVSQTLLRSGDGMAAFSLGRRPSAWAWAKLPMTPLVPAGGRLLPGHLAHESRSPVSAQGGNTHQA